MTKEEENSWFEEWFNTHYYHMLYKHRDDHEARVFIDALFDELAPVPQWHVLDLACGRGRHARYVHHKGVKVTGLDLAESNISYASRYLEEGLQFQVADMRKPYGQNEYDLILNLFTSFGYFDNWEDNLSALQQAKRALKPGGLLVIDFLNVDLVREKLIPSEELRIEDYQFQINRSMNEQRILKTIDLKEPNGKEHHFKEEVWALSLDDFQTLFKACDIELISTWGSYNLAKFEARKSERLILLARA